MLSDAPEIDWVLARSREILERSEQVFRRNIAVRATSARLFARLPVGRPIRGAADGGEPAGEPAGERTRYERTLDKARRGGLPAPVTTNVWAGRGSRTRCSGCDDVVMPAEREWQIELLEGALILRFHPECYTAWLRSKPPA